jgi:hypothetical protein
MIITKTEYTYICSLGSGMAKAVVLISANNTLILWENSDGTEFKTIDEAEQYLCKNYQEVILDNKTDYVITKLERIVQ